MSAPAKKVRNVMEEASTAAAREEDATVADLSTLTTTALAGLGGGKHTEPPAVVDDDAASVATSASYFTNRWLPGGLLDAEQVGSTSTLNAAAPVFVPRAPHANPFAKGFARVSPR